jgi:hypothetical protein
MIYITSVVAITGWVGCFWFWTEFLFEQEERCKYQNIAEGKAWTDKRTDRKYN